MTKTIIKECHKHGDTEHALRSDKRYRCKKCAVEAVQRRRNKIKQKAVDHLGGSCENCGYDNYLGALEFHHKDPNEKDFAIAEKGLTRSWELIKSEIEKCILLCSNCHREIHAGLF